MLRKLWFDLAYRFTQPRWDTGITPPELVELIETRQLPAGRALDLGCGTGTNVLYLARHGWQAIGVDFVGWAIDAARRKARAAGLTANFHRADVTRLNFLQPPIDLALDIGCFHSIAAERRPAYIAGLTRLVRPRGLFLCYAFKPEAQAGGPAVDEMTDLFAAGFELRQVEHGQGTPSAWYTFARR
jgi:cyclopropane fatty-acyl-phospholipid synthase-like methyltransferase